MVLDHSLVQLLDRKRHACSKQQKRTSRLYTSQLVFQTVMSLDLNVASSVSGSSDYQSVVDLTTADDEVLVVSYLAKQDSTVEPEASSIDVADSPCSAATPSFSDRSHSHSQASLQGENTIPQ